MDGGLSLADELAGLDPMLHSTAKAESASGSAIIDMDGGLDDLDLVIQDAPSEYGSVPAPTSSSAIANSRVTSLKSKGTDGDDSSNDSLDMDGDEDDDSGLVRGGRTDNNGRNKVLRQSMDVVLDNFGGEVFLTLLASIIITAQASDLCGTGGCTSREGFAVSVGVISMVTCLTYIIALKADKIKGTKVLYYMSGGLFLWWSIGVLALTFNAPFNSLLEANGYCGTWLGFVSSCRLLYANVETLRSKTLELQAKFIEKRLHVALCLASVVVFLDAVIGDDDDKSDPKTIWIICVSLLSIMMATFLIVYGHRLETLPGLGDYDSIAPKVIGAFLVVWWTAGAAIATFFGPFQAAGNGYFGCMVALVASGHILVDAVMADTKDSKAREVLSISAQ